MHLFSLVWNEMVTCTTGNRESNPKLLIKRFFFSLVVKQSLLLLAPFQDHIAVMMRKKIKKKKGEKKREKVEYLSKYCIISHSECLRK